MKNACTSFPNITLLFDNAFTISPNCQDCSQAAVLVVNAVQLLAPRALRANAGALDDGTRASGLAAAASASMAVAAPAERALLPALEWATIERLHLLFSESHCPAPCFCTAHRALARLC